MELEVSLERWSFLAGQMEESIRRISRQEAELDGICQELHRQPGTESILPVIRSIQKERDHLHEQALHMTDMKVALEKIRRAYIDCEEDVINAGEASRKRFPENFQTVNLSGYKFVDAILK